MVIPKRLERLTYCLEGSCSIQLSYGTNLEFAKSGANLVQFVGFTKKNGIYFIVILFNPMLCCTFVRIFNYKTRIVVTLCRCLAISFG